MKFYKVIIREKSSVTAYIEASNEKEARNKAIFSDIVSYQNQDFEQEILKIEEINKHDIISIGRSINIK